MRIDQKPNKMYCINCKSPYPNKQNVASFKNRQQYDLKGHLKMQLFDVLERTPVFHRVASNCIARIYLKTKISHEYAGNFR